MSHVVCSTKDFWAVGNLLIRNLTGNNNYKNCLNKMLSEAYYKLGFSSKGFTYMY